MTNPYSLSFPMEMEPVHFRSPVIEAALALITEHGKQADIMAHSAIEALRSHPEESRVSYQTETVLDKRRAGLFGSKSEGAIVLRTTGSVEIG